MDYKESICKLLDEADNRALKIIYTFAKAVLNK
ncbi:Uncharacterised protein [uncultured Eubacterium sp.]|nr:Uncharacterised protein [uncultured Eubacterium sp.]